LKTANRPNEAIAAYRRAIAMKPTLGEAYWSLANLKTFRFTAADRMAMTAARACTELDAEDRLHLDFALGKALEDSADYARSFRHYADAARLRRTLQPYDAGRHSEFVRRCRTTFTADFFHCRPGGHPSPAPIFIVGLPRAGSTLVEQILASHSRVEGTMELPDLPQIALELSGRGAGADRPSGGDDSGEFLDAVAALSAQQRRALGARYLEQTQRQRKTTAAFFIDKMPNNFLYLGLIELILPNAKIIDARRHPLGCCFSAFKQHFARGQNFSYDLDDLGRYYRDYVELMAHFDAVLPGRVHRVHYEAMVENTEACVRALLEFCGLPFEAACLNFHLNDRAVRTASSMQVRQPIFRDGLDQWRHFEPWLGPLKESLGAVLDAYPEAPIVSTAE
jgi:tetratricopeptide (TPR) repeat protein